MRKFLTICGLFLFPLVKVQALPVGNPWDASLLCSGVFWEGDCCNEPIYSVCGACDAWSVRFGFYGDYVFNRFLKTREGDRSIKTTKMYTNAGFIAFNFWNKVDLYATLGASHIFIGTRRSALQAPGANNTSIRLESDTGPSYTVGIRGTLWECGDFALGLDGKYFTTRPSLNYTVSETSPRPTYRSGVLFKYKEWQVALGGAYLLHIAPSISISPYASAYWGLATLTFGSGPFVGFANGIQLNNMKSEFDWSYAVGATLIGCEYWSLTAEARLAGELAFHLNTQFRF